MEIEKITWLLNFKKTSLIEKTMETLKKFQIPDIEKLRAIKNLTTLLSYIKKELEFAHFSEIFKIISKILINYKDQDLFKKAIKDLMTTLGGCLDLNNSIYIILEIIEEDIDKENFNILIYRLFLLKNLVKGNFFLEEGNIFYKRIISTMSKLNRLILDNDLICIHISEFFENLIKLEIKNKFELDLESKEKLFILLLLLKKKNFIIKQNFDFDNIIFVISQQCSRTKEEFIYECSKNFIEKIYFEKSYKNWESYTLERIKFNSLIKNSIETSLKFIDIILNIISEEVELKKDFTTRFEALESLNNIIESDSKKILKNYSEKILTEIIQKTLIWKIGKPNNKIRKASIINFLSLLKKENFNIKILFKNFNKYSPLIKSCSDDDWASDLRFITIELSEKILKELKNELTRDNIIEFYEHIINRLDDAQDDIRIKASDCFFFIFDCKNCHFSNNIFEFILKTFFIHFDDSNFDLQISVFKVLRKMGGVKLDMVLEFAERKLKDFRFNENCKKLIEELKNLK